MIGSTISHYRIVEKLGEGGMGVVYQAERATLEPGVSLKFLADHLLLDDEGKERFLRAAKAAAALHHSNVRPVYEIDEVAIHSWGPGPCFRRGLGHRRDVSF